MNDRQRRLRLDALERIRRVQTGHSGRVLSSLDLLEALYFGDEHGRPIFKCNPMVPQWEERDLFVLSKVEALPALYSVLEEARFRLPTVLPLLPDRKTPGVDVSLDRSGEGFGIAVGLALAMQRKKEYRHVFCLAADYELDRGSFWEAAAFAAEQRLDRLTLILDENDPRDLRIQEKFEAFGWKVIKVLTPHDHDDMVFALLRSRVPQRKPTLIWAKTVKSSGIPFAERKAEYDDIVFSDPEMQEARNILS